MTEPTEYRGARIFLRRCKGGYTSDFGWLGETSHRLAGGFGTHPQVAKLKAKEAIDAEIAKQDINVRWFRTALV